MSQNNTQLIQSIYAAFGRGDVAFITAQLAPNSHWDFNVRHSDVPWHIPASGAAEIPRFFGALAEDTSFEAFEPLHFMDIGDDVIVHVHLVYTVKKTGKRVDEEQLQWWTIKEGKITRLRHFEDTAQVVAAWRGN